MKSKDRDLGHSDVSTLWEEASEGGEEQPLVWTKEDVGALKPREDSGPSSVDGSALSSAADG